MAYMSPDTMMDSSTAYEPSHVEALTDGISEKDFADVIFPRKPPALTTRLSSFKFPTPNELTPPPSPPRQSSPAGFNFGPLLHRASSALGNLQSEPPRRAPDAENGSQKQTQQATSMRKKKPSKTLEAFADLFSGTSAPITPGPIPSRSPPPKQDNPFKAPPPRPSSKPARPGHQRRSSTLSVAASLLGLAPPRRPPQPRIPEDAEDPYLDLDLESELFPNGLPDPTAPSAFDDLLSSAEKLFLNMQAAYKDKCRAVWEVSATHNVEQDELDEARTRAKHLKFQLDGLSAKFAEQDEAMKSLTNELLSERQSRQREREKRLASIRIVDEANESNDTRLFSQGDCGSTCSLESGENSGRDSVFSRPQSSAGSETTQSELSLNSAPPTALAGLRRENLLLRSRVAELEETVEGCLGLVHGL